MWVFKMSLAPNYNKYFISLRFNTNYKCGYELFVINKSTKTVVKMLV